MTLAGGVDTGHADDGSPGRSYISMRGERGVNDGLNIQCVPKWVPLNRTSTAAQCFLQMLGQSNRERDDRERRVRDPRSRKYRGARDIKVVERMHLEIRVDHPLRWVIRHTRSPEVVSIHDQLAFYCSPVRVGDSAMEIVHSRLK